MFEGWDSFYLLVGGAAGALIGTMFVVVTLTAGLDPDRLPRGAQIFITPIVFHFGVALVMSVLTAIPHLSREVLSLILAVGAIVGLAYAAVTTFRIIKLDWEYYSPDLSDKFFYGAAPILIYLALGYAAWSVWIAAEDAPYVICWVALVLLAVGIRNAWDLARSLVQQQREKKPN